MDTGRADGGWNLALDEALFRLAEENRVAPTLRIYGWSSPALSVGYFQRWEQEIDAVACRQAGVPVFRRATGGRAVYHACETTYSVVAPTCIEGFDGGLVASYRTIARGLAEGLGFLGVRTAVAPPVRGTAREGLRNPSCFAAASGYELTAEGGKLVGSAQKRGRRSLMQHGSILHESHSRELAPLLRPGVGPPPETASLKSVLGRSPGDREVAKALRRGFEKAWGVTFVETPLKKEEKALTEELRARRYGSLTE